MTEQTIRTITQVVITADEPNHNNRVYPSAVLRDAIAEAQKRMEGRRMYGTTQPGPIRLAKISHVVTALSLEGQNLTATIELLDTPEGLAVMKALDEGGRITMSLKGSGVVVAYETQEVVRSYEMESVSISVEPRTSLN